MYARGLPALVGPTYIDTDTLGLHTIPPEPALIASHEHDIYRHALRMVMRCPHKPELTIRFEGVDFLWPSQPHRPKL
jgi:hypothetical protein